MPDYYATPTEVENITGLEEVSEAETEQASLDLDLYALGARPSRNSETGLKLTPADLSEPQQAAVKRACAIQVKYRRKMGVDFFETPQRGGTIKIDGIEYSGTLPLASQQAQDLLADYGLIDRTGTVTSRPEWVEPYNRGWKGA